MKKLHLLRVAAVGVTAAALTISGASMAAASEPTVAQHTDRPATAAPATAQGWAVKATKSAKVASGDVGIASVGTFSFKSGVLSTSGYNFIRGTVTITDVGANRITSEVWVNGVYRGLADLIPTGATSGGRPIPSGAFILGTSGPGRVTLRNTKVYNGNTLLSTTTKDSNAFYFRRDTFGAFKVRHRGKRVSMSIRAQVRATDGSRASAGTAYVQYVKSGRWKHLKRVRLNSYGKGSYKYSTRSKRTYRLVVKKTTKVQGMTIKLRKL